MVDNLRKPYEKNKITITQPTGKQTNIKVKKENIQLNDENTPKETPNIDIKKAWCVSIMSNDFGLNHSIICFKDEKFSSLEHRFYDDWPEHRNENNFFVANGKLLVRDKTIEENGIKNHDKIMIYNNKSDNIEDNKNVIENIQVEDKEEIWAVLIKTLDSQVNCPIPISSDAKFSDLLKVFYKKYPELNKQNNLFLCCGKMMNENLTLKENGIKDQDIIILNYDNQFYDN